MLLNTKNRNLLKNIEGSIVISIISLCLFIYSFIDPCEGLFFPRIILILIFFASCFEVIRIIKVKEVLENDVFPTILWIIIPTFLTLIYVQLVLNLGLISSTFITSLILMTWLRKRMDYKILLISLINSFSIWFILDYLIRVYFPVALLF